MTEYPEMKTDQSVSFLLFCELYLLYFKRIHRKIVSSVISSCQFLVSLNVCNKYGLVDIFGTRPCCCNLYTDPRRLCSEKKEGEWTSVCEVHFSPFRISPEKYLQCLQAPKAPFPNLPRRPRALLLSCFVNGWPRRLFSVTGKQCGIKKNWPGG